MAVDFGILAQTPTIGARYAEGLQAAQAERDRNMLRQQQAAQIAMQQENMLAQRQERASLTAQRQTQEARAAQRQQFLTGAAEALAKGGATLDRPTLMKVLQSGVQADEPTLIQFAREGLKALDEEDLYQRETARLGLPGAATPAAPTNAMAAPAGITRDTVQNMMMSPSGRIREQGKALVPTLEKEAATPADVATMKALGFPLTAAGYAQYRDAQRQERMLSPAEEAQRIRIAQASRPPVQPKEPKDDPRTVVAFRETDAAGNVTLLNKFGDVITPSAPVKGKPTATFEKTTAQRKQLAVDLDRAITELKEVSKKGGLIDQSTGSGAGRGVDIAAGFFGKATPGAIAIGKLAPIADLVLKMVPRFEGPQSDKDTRSYKEAAGQLADATLPNAIRKDAAIEIVRLMEARKGQFVTQEMAAEGVGAAPAPIKRREIAPGVFVTERP